MNKGNTHRWSWKFWPLRNKVFLLMLLISLLPVGFVTGYSIYSISDTMKQRSINDLKTAFFGFKTS